jgi:hypothetical protein
MRRLEQLINDIRFNSDNLQTSRFASIRLMKFFNDAQRELQSLIVSMDSAEKWFTEFQYQDLVYLQESYDLPSDIFGLSYVRSVGRAVDQSPDNQLYVPLDMISEKERRYRLGYILAASKILMSPLPTVNLGSGLRISYVKQLPTLSIRVGQISSFTPGVSIQLGAGYITDQITDYDDFISVVDQDGLIQQSGIRVTGYNTGTGLISTSSTLADVSNGDYVVIGKVSTTNSQLPDVCEGVLTSMVEKAMQRVDASQEFNWADLVSEEQKAAIMAVVQGGQHDTMYPPITDWEAIND